MAPAAHADTVAGDYGLPSHTATGIVRSGFAARLGPVVECVGSPLDNRINNETAHRGPHSLTAVSENAFF